MDQLIEKLQEEPMMRYTPTMEEIEQICQTYEIGQWLKTEGELGGLFNVNLKIMTTTGTYVIRVHSGLSRQYHLETEHRLLQTLTHRGLPVLAPLSTKQEMNFIQLHGRFVQLTPFVEGTAFGYLPQQIHSSAVILRTFHDVLMNETDIPAPFWSNYPAHQVLQEGMDKLKEEQREMHDSALINEVDYLYQVIMDEWLLQEDELVKSVIHADWHPWNLIFDEDHKVKYILDFDSLQRGERIHDVAYFLWAVRHERNSQEIGKHFLKGYGPLASLEKEMLPLAIARASLFFLCTASFISDPVAELQKQIKEQKPYIDWVLSKAGRRCIYNLLRD